MSKLIASKIASAIKKNHICTIAYGSRARGDPKDNSDLDLDLDLVIICKNVNAELLEKVGKACLELNVGYEINPQVMCESEMVRFPNEMGVSKLHMEGEKLVGGIKLPKFSIEECINISTELLSESLMSIRHYIVSGEFQELPNHKFHRFVKKPLLHGIRFHHFAKEKLCRSNFELESIYPELRMSSGKFLTELCLRVMAFNKSIN